MTRSQNARQNCFFLCLRPALCDRVWPGHRHVQEVFSGTAVVPSSHLEILFWFGVMCLTMLSGKLSAQFLEHDSAADLHMQLSCE